MFYHIWTSPLFWSSDQKHLEKLSFSLSLGAPFEFAPISQYHPEKIFLKYHYYHKIDMTVTSDQTLKATKNVSYRLCGF